ncbi:metal-dependent hydrolase [Qipengyuania sp. JC766]|uniref:metal-dependent hydrolase n=1 Tax=Qipengyuania sp. JC766 TaxID=3232139 RepID=UPI003458C51F
MDNFTHSMAGWALGQTGLKKLTRKGLAALILGANMPDIDVFFDWVPWAPLATHRGFTHGLVGGVLLMPPILAWLLWQLDKWQVRRGHAFKSGLEMHFGWLLALSYLGALTHPLLDWQNTYAVQLLSPFSNLWFHNSALFIIDVWVWTGVAFAIWLSRKREKQQRPAWRSPPAIALTVVVAYIAVNGWIGAQARLAPTRGEPGLAPEVIIAGPQPALFWKRDVVWRTDGVIYQGTFDPFASTRELTSWTRIGPDNMDDPVARAALDATHPVRDFMRWSLLPMATVERGQCEATVIYEDARYLDIPNSDSFKREVTIPVAGTGCPANAS